MKKIKICRGQFFAIEWLDILNNANVMTIPAPKKKKIGRAFGKRLQAIEGWAIIVADNGPSAER